MQPKLDRLRRFLGPVGFRRKRRLLAGARCLLVPSVAPETSSLVAMEAAAGTPVIAFPNGALGEIVEHERTGFLVNSFEELTTAITRAHEIEPETCRAVAHARFSEASMVERYIELYGRLTA